MANPRYPIALRDRMMLGEKVIVVVGPIELPTRQAAVDALYSIAAQNPRTRIAFEAQTSGRHWLRHDDDLKSWCNELVLTAPPVDRDTVIGLALQQASLLDGAHPMFFILAGDFIIHISDHSVGDGGAFIDRLTTVLRIARGDTGASAWTTAEPQRWPLLAAAYETFLRKRSLGAVFAARRDEAELKHSDDDGALVPWSPQRSVVMASAPSSTLKVTQKWIRETDRSLSVSAALIILIRRAFEAAGIPVHPETKVLFDLRRYLPATGRTVRGNFISGLPLHLLDPDDVGQVSAALVKHLETGHPLAALLVGIAKRIVFGGTSKVPDRVPKPSRARVVFNNLGVSRQLQGLRWKAEPEARRCGFIARPEGPEHVTVAVVIVNGVMHFSLSFHANVIDEVAVAQALQQLIDDPRSLLEQDATAG